MAREGDKETRAVDFDDDDNDNDDLRLKFDSFLFD